jgi:hypothetical protein
MKATTLDIMVMDISLSYERMKNDKNAGRTPNIKQEVLEEVIKKFKEKR